MAYTPNTWVNRVANGDNRFIDQNNNVYEFTPAPISVEQNGTPFSAEWMNHIEQGIAANDAAVSKIGTLLWSGNWTPSSGAPSSIPGLSNYSVFFIMCGAFPVLACENDNVISGIGTSRIIFSDGTCTLVVITITHDGDTISGADQFDISQITINAGTTGTNCQPLTSTPITAIYGIF